MRIFYSSILEGYIDSRRQLSCLRQNWPMSLKLTNPGGKMFGM